MTFKKWDFITFKMNIISIRKHIADTVVVSDVICEGENVTTHVVIGFFCNNVIY